MEVFFNGEIESIPMWMESSIPHGFFIPDLTTKLSIKWTMRNATESRRNHYHHHVVERLFSMGKLRVLGGM